VRPTAVLNGLLCADVPLRNYTHPRQTAISDLVVCVSVRPSTTGA